MEKTYLQITSGHGPVECCRAVALVLKRVLKQVRVRKLKVEIVEKGADPANRALLSVVTALEGVGCDILVKEWEGTMSWIARNPYRIHYRRRNQFIDVWTLLLPKSHEMIENEIRYEALWASGPGKQHVDKTELVARAVHIPSETSVVAPGQRSQ